MKNILGSQTRNQTQDLSLLQKNLSIPNTNIHLLPYHKVINNPYHVTFLYIFVYFRSYAGIFVRFYTNFHRCLPPKTDKIKHINNTYNFLTKKNQIEFGFELLNFQDRNIFQAVFLLLAPLLELLKISLSFSVSTLSYRYPV